MLFMLVRTVAVYKIKDACPGRRQEDRYKYQAWRSNLDCT